MDDQVLAEDPETGRQGYFEVVALTNHPAGEILKVTIDAGADRPGSRNSAVTPLDTLAEHPDNEEDQLNSDAGDDHSTPQPAGSSTHTEIMEVTPDHPMYVEDAGWIWAENLTIGDRLRRADGGWARVLAVERVELETPQRVYNFTVKGPHTYFVLEVGVLVHNARCGPNESGLLARYKQTRWKSAGYDVNNLKIQNLIGEGYYPEDVIKLYRGQGEIYPEVLSPIARINGIEASERRVRELHPEFPAPDGDPFLQAIHMHKSSDYSGTRYDAFISMTTNYEVARAYALLNAETGTSPVVLEIIIPKSKVVEIQGNNEFEFAIAHHLPEEYITNTYFVNSKTFSPEFEAGLKILEKYEPGYAHLLRDGIIPIIDDTYWPGRPGEAMMFAHGLVLSPDPDYPGTTAKVMYEEISHAFQGRMTGFEAEMEAKRLAVEFVIRNNIEIRPSISSAYDVFGYQDNGLQGLAEAIYDVYGSVKLQNGERYLENIFPPSILYRRFDPSQFRQQ